MATPAYKRILLKLSGEALVGSQNNGIDTKVAVAVAKEIKTVRRLLIRRSNPALGESSVNFTLVDSRIPDESMYRAEGHLSESSNVLSMDSSLDKRREILMGWFGGMAERWIKSRD